MHVQRENERVNYINEYSHTENITCLCISIKPDKTMTALHRSLSVGPAEFRCHRAWLPQRV